MMYGAAASTRTTQNTRREGLRAAKLRFSPTVVAASALALTSQAQYERLHIFPVYTR